MIVYNKREYLVKVKEDYIWKKKLNLFLQLQSFFLLSSLQFVG